MRAIAGLAGLALLIAAVAGGKVSGHSLGLLIPGMFLVIIAAVWKK